MLSGKDRARVGVKEKKNDGLVGAKTSGELAELAQASAEKLEQTGPAEKGKGGLSATK